MSNIIARTLLVAACLMGLCTCASADVMWTLNVTFTDGMTATGTFETTGGSATVAPTFVEWDVVFSGGTLAHDFTDSSSTTPPGAIGVQFPPNSSWPTATAEELSFAHEPGFDPYVDFFLASTLTDAGGPIAFDGASACDGTCYGINQDRAHTLDGVATPEPGAIVLFGTIVFAVGLALRRKAARAA